MICLMGDGAAFDWNDLPVGGFLSLAGWPAQIGRVGDTDSIFRERVKETPPKA